MLMNDKIMFDRYRSMGKEVRTLKEEKKKMFDRYYCINSTKSLQKMKKILAHYILYFPTRVHMTQAKE